MRFWLTRLKALNHPLVWGAGCAVLLVAVGLGQYIRHPEWFDSFQSMQPSPGQRPTDPTLSPQDEANLADIDNLSLLMDQVNAPAGAPQPVPTPAPGTDSRGIDSPPGDGSELLTDRLNLEGSNNPVPVRADSGSPFANYLDRLRFGSHRSTPVTPAMPGQTGAGSASLFDLADLYNASSLATMAPATPNPDGLSPVAAPASPLSPLQWALEQQRLADQAQSQAASAESGGTNPDHPQAADSSLDGLTTPPWLVTGTLPASQQSFIQTVPQMSPPPGTTGYSAPPTLELNAPFTGQANYAPSSLPGASPLTPNFSPPAASQPASPSLQYPGTGLTAGPTSGSLYQAPVQPSPAPFTVPRPPGSYTGGGYIYTFSDPSGAVP